MNKKKRLLIAACILLAIAIGAVLAYVEVSRRVGMKGKIKTRSITAYKDKDCTIPLTEVDWGLIENGSTVTLRYYLKNTGNTKVLGINYAVEALNPPDLKVKIDKFNTKPLDPGESFAATVEMEITCPTVEFSFDLVIVATCE